MPAPSCSPRARCNPLPLSLICTPPASARPFSPRPTLRRRRAPRARRRLRQFAGIDSTGYSWWFTPRSLASRRQQAVAKLVTVERQRRDNGTLSQFGATPACGAVVRSCRTPLMSSLERRSHLAHEALHLFFHLRVRLQAAVEVEDHLREAGGLDLRQRVGHLA